MITASFSCPLRNKRIIHGTIVKKDDGKVSISLDHPSDYSANDCYLAKAIANKIVLADFKSEHVTSFKEDNQSLVKILKSYTEDLRVEYIQRCKSWEEKNFNGTIKWLAKVDNLLSGTKEWYDFFGIRTRVVYPGTKNEFYSYDSYNSSLDFKYSKSPERKYYTAQGQIRAAQSYINKGLNVALLNAEKQAIQHYEDSISLLASRIEKKGMNIAKMKVVKKSINMNIEMVLSDGIVTVKAWNIWAEGQINIPHYRYLVK